VAYHCGLYRQTTLERCCRWFMRLVDTNRPLLTLSSLLHILSALRPLWKGVLWCFCVLLVHKDCLCKGQLLWLLGVLVHTDRSGEAYYCGVWVFLVHRDCLWKGLLLWLLVVVDADRLLWKGVLLWQQHGALQACCGGSGPAASFRTWRIDTCFPGRCVTCSPCDST
jgi:hypothetical protein